MCSPVLSPLAAKQISEIKDFLLTARRRTPNVRCSASQCLSPWKWGRQEGRGGCAGLDVSPSCPPSHHLCVWRHGLRCSLRRSGSSLAAARASRSRGRDCCSHAPLLPPNVRSRQDQEVQGRRQVQGPLQQYLYTLCVKDLEKAAMKQSLPPGYRQGHLSRASGVAGETTNVCPL